MARSYEVETTEALAVKEGVLLARERELHQIILEIDSLAVVQALNTRSSHGEHEQLESVAPKKGLQQWCMN